MKADVYSAEVQQQTQTYLLQQQPMKQIKANVYPFSCHQELYAAV